MNRRNGTSWNETDVAADICPVVLSGNAANNAFLAIKWNGNGNKTKKHGIQWKMCNIDGQIYGYLDISVKLIKTAVGRE